VAESYTALLEDVCRVLGIEPADPVIQSGTLTVDDVDVYLDYRDEAFETSVVIYTDLGAVPPEAPATLLRNLLEANLLWAGTGGATIGLHPETGQAVLSYAMPFDGLTGEGLGAALAQFAKVAKFWREFIADTRNNTTLGAAANPMGEGPGDVLRV